MSGYKQILYTFGVDGTTDGYTEGTDNWHSVQVSFNSNSISYNDAKSIVQNLTFPQGNPDPAKSMSEFKGLLPGQSKEEDETNNNLASEQSSNPTPTPTPIVQPDRIFSDGPLSFSVPQSAMVEISQSYAEYGLMSQASYQAYENEQASSLLSSINVSTVQFHHENLDQWAAYYQHSWQSSEQNSSVYSERFKTDSGFSAIAILREKESPYLGKVRDYYIIVDLTTNKWKQRYQQNENADANAWLGVQISGLSVPVSGDHYSNAIAIAKSLDFDPSAIPSIPAFSENTAPSTPRSDNGSQIAETNSISIVASSLTLGSSWYESNWLGAFYLAENNWIYHRTLGWLHLDGTSTSESWMWHDFFGWIWTSFEAAPYFYSADNQNWLFFDDTYLSDGYYYDFLSNSWIDLMEIEELIRSNTGNELQTITEIMHSNSTEENKLDAIAEIILFGN